MGTLILVQHAALNPSLFRYPYYYDQLYYNGNDGTAVSKSCPGGGGSLHQDDGSSSFVTHDAAKRIVQDTMSGLDQSQRPHQLLRFLTKLIDHATLNQQYLFTFQIGGMDGTSGDYFYTMTQTLGNTSSLEYWMPVVVEPVPSNFEKLQETYQLYHDERQLRCYSLLKQIISYDDVDDGVCKFCHFDENTTDPYCHQQPHWLKNQLGGMECNIRANVAKCFVKSEWRCSGVGKALSSSLMPPMDKIAVMIIDVEGSEKKVLEGFFQELKEQHMAPPPVLYFEHKVLREQNISLTSIYHTLQHTFGYSIHEATEDTLAVLGFNGPNTLLGP